MTTKQEIIKTLNEFNTNQEFSYNIYSALMYIIEDLKPEIKVKKLVWHKYEDYFWYTYLYKLGCDDDFYVKCKIYPPYKSREDFTVSYSIRSLESERRHFSTLEEAQCYVQNIQDEYVLSLVEVE